MAVLFYQRVNESTKVSGKVGEPMNIVERWQIRVDSPATSKAEIVSSTAVGWLTPHFEFSSCLAHEFELSPADRSGMMWYLTVTYYPQVPGKELSGGIPQDSWELSGGTSVFPLFDDKDGNSVTNSAGDPLEGLEFELSTSTLTLTRSYTADSALISALTEYVDTVNDATWFGWPANRVKCVFRSATVKTAQPYGSDEPFKWIEARWDFEYKRGGWLAKPWDVGFMELVDDERRAILGDDGKAVKQPVALNSDGTAKDPGEEPSILTFDIYYAADFTAGFGEPVFI